MDVKNALSMKGGEGETSYAKTSIYTRKVISTTKPIIEEAARNSYCDTLPDTFTVADLGCASGSNSVLAISMAIEAVAKSCQEQDRRLPDFQVLLNDLPGNDFNLVFKDLAAFCEKLKEENGGSSCFVAGVPGSFYERLFVRNSLHFVHSSYSVHWLSQVPIGLRNEAGFPLNKGRIYISETSPPGVWKAYLEQFQKDFTLFLKLRAKEVVPHGQMVLTVHGRDTVNTPCTDTWGLLGETLADMVCEGYVEEEKLDSFDVPYYTPSEEEVQDIITKDGSFSLEYMEAFSVEKDDKHDDKIMKGEKVARHIRAFTEPILAHHFGEEMMEMLFEKFTSKFVDYLPKNKSKAISISTVLKRKG